MNAPTPDPMLRMTPQKASQRMVAADGSKRVSLDRLRAAADAGGRLAAEALAKHDRAMAEIAESIAPEVTPAVRRTAEAMEDAALRLVGRDLGTIHRDQIAREGLDAGLDVEEMARAADPKAFEDHPIELRSRPAALQWAVRRKIATDHARAIRDAILGADQ